MRNLNFNGESGSEPYTPTTQSLGVAGSDGFYSPGLRWWWWSWRGRFKVRLWGKMVPMARFGIQWWWHLRLWQSKAFRIRFDRLWWFGGGGGRPTHNGSWLDVTRMRKTRKLTFFYSRRFLICFLNQTLKVKIYLFYILIDSSGF